MATIQSRIETITPEIAREYLAHNVSNRKANKDQILHYARMMMNGQWMLNGETIIFDKNGNLLDGQHRLMAVVESGVTIQSFVVRDIDINAFVTIDRGKKRSISDSFCKDGIQNYSRVSAGIRKWLTMRAMNVRSLGSIGASNRCKPSTQDCIDEYNNRPEFWQYETNFSGRCYDRCRLIAGTDVIAITAYLHITKGYPIDIVHNFFEQLFFEEKTVNKTLALFRRMIVKDSMGTKNMSTKYKTQLLVRCWEAYKANKDYKVLKWDREREPEKTFE